MTLLVVLGIVVVVTILAALFLSLRSGRSRDGASAAGAAGYRSGRGGSRSERSPSLAERARAIAGRSKNDDEYPGRRVAGRSREDFDDDFAPSGRGPRGSRAGQNRSGLVASGTGRQQGRGRPDPGFDDADRGFAGGYGPDSGGYDGYDTGPTGPISAEPGTEVFGSGGYATQEPAGRARRGTGRGGAGPAGRGGPESYREAGRDNYGPPKPDFGPRDRAARPAAAAYGSDPDDSTATASFADPGQDPGRPDPADRPDDDESGRGGARRRIGGRIQRPRLRRDRADFDEDPWPSYEEDEGAIPDDKYWADMYSDRPLSTTARTAHPASEADQGWGGPDPAAAQAEPDAAPMGRGRRGRRRAEDTPDAGTEPRPQAQPGPGPAASGGRHGVPRPSQPPEDPLTSESFSRQAREATDSRSYRGSRAADQNRPPAPGRPDSASADTQSMRPDPRGYGADPLSGPSPLSPRPPAGNRPGGPGRPGSGYPGDGPGGGYPAGPGDGYPAGPGGGRPSTAPANGLKPTGPGNGLPPAGRPDPYASRGYRNGAAPDNGYRGQDNGYRNGTGPSGYPDRSAGYPPPSRGGRAPGAPGSARPGPAGSPPPGASYPANGRPPAPGGAPGGGRRARPALPAPGQGSGPVPGSNGWSSGANGTGGPGGPAGGDRRPTYGPYGGSPYPGAPAGGPAYPDGGYPDDQGRRPPAPPSPNGTGEHGRGRRGTDRDNGRRRPDDGYDDPYRRDGRGY